LRPAAGVEKFINKGALQCLVLLPFQPADCPAGILAPGNFQAVPVLEKPGAPGLLRKGFSHTEGTEQ